MSVFDCLPDELLEQVFLAVGNLPSPTNNNHIRTSPNSLYFDYSIQQSLSKETHSSLRSISLVCRRFYRILRSSDFWERKCRHDYILLPTNTFPSEFNDYEKLYISNPFHPSFNFIIEDKWRKSPGSDTQIELVPIGAHRLVDDFGRFSSCRATSYSWAHIHQRDIQLFPEVLSWENLGCLNPIIEFSVCVAPRWDCASECRIVLLFSDGHRWEYQKRFAQWNDSKWHRLAYKYKKYQTFPSSVTVSLFGKDSQFWAGFYGVKFAQARLRLLCIIDDSVTNEESETIIEPKAEDEFNPSPQPNPVLDNLLVEENSIDESSSTLYSSDDDQERDI